ncbi:MAG: hypothetical protein MUP09_04530, partial [Thiovulaceae bacterium]|nr:hypothetical protein [Sulfurimonadaceae bacterium]
MKNVLLAIMAAAVMMFSGCSSKEATPAGYTGPAEVSTYFIAPLMSTEEVKSKLESAGFEIVAVDKVGKANLD